MYSTWDGKTWNKRLLIFCRTLSLTLRNLRTHNVIVKCAQGEKPHNCHFTFFKIYLGAGCDPSAPLLQREVNCAYINNLSMVFNPQTWATENACKDPAIVMSMSEESMKEIGACHRGDNTLLTMWIINSTHSCEICKLIWCFKD